MNIRNTSNPQIPNSLFQTLQLSSDPQKTTSMTSLQKRPSNDKKKRIRRSKDERVPRNYLCGCNKTYLSYAALYTHTKTKHNGVFPEGTTTLSKRKQMQNENDDWKNVRSSSEYQRTYDLNKEFQLFLAKIPGSIDEKDKRNKNLIEFFPCEIFKSVDFYGKLLVTLEQIRKELIDSYGGNFILQIDIIIFEINNSKKLNCYQAVSLFLIYVFRFCSKGFYRDLVFVLVSYLKLLNERGWKSLPENSTEVKFQHNSENLNVKMATFLQTEKTDLKNEFLSSEGISGTDFCENQTAEFIPLLANYFISEFFLDCLSTDSLVFHPKNLGYFKLEPLNLLWVIILLKFFCHWLYIHRFTKSRLEIHQE